MPTVEVETVDPILPTPTLPISTPEIVPTEVIKFVAYVNGEGISKEIFLAEMSQYEEALEKGEVRLEDGQTPRDIVIEDIVYRLLLSQAARNADFYATPDIVNERLNQMKINLGGEEALTAWMIGNGYSSESFYEALKLEIEAGWQRNQIFNAVPRESEQALARQLFFYSNAQALAAYNLLENGNSFDFVVQEYDPENLGNLDWFPRNYLLLPEIENLAFSLQLGEYSGIVETEFGFHILQLIDYNPAKELTADILLNLQEKALYSWLEGQWAQSQIEVLQP